MLLEAFKGDQYDWRSENSAKNWATGYDFPGAAAGRVILEKFPDKASGLMQAFVPNLRRAKFRIARVRLALNYAWDFESHEGLDLLRPVQADRQLFRRHRAGLVRAADRASELEILERVRDKVPPEVFTTPYANPVGGTPEKSATTCARRCSCLQAAGYELRGRQLVNAQTGEPFTIELLTTTRRIERYLLPYQQNLAKIGITLTIRSVDSRSISSGCASAIST